MSEDPFVKKVLNGAIWTDEPKKIFPDVMSALEERRPRSKKGLSKFATKKDLKSAEK